MNKRKKLNAGYSLLEMVITLVVVNIVLLMLSNVLVISLRIASQSQSRAEAREEIASSINLIKRDIRNASTYSENCKGAANSFNSPFCSVSTGSNQIDWTLCVNERDSTGYSVCKYVDGILSYKSSPNLVINDLRIIQIGTDTGGSDEISLLITLIGHHFNDDEDDPTLYRQEIVSTRNYRI